MALTLASPFASSITTRRPAQRSKSTASTLTWSSSTGKVLRREISCRAEVNANATSRSTPSISASVRIDFDMRQTVSLPPSPNLRESRKHDWVFDGPLFLSDGNSATTNEVRSLLSLEDSEGLSSGYVSCDPSPAGFFEENDFLFPSSTSSLSPSDSNPLFTPCNMTPRPRSVSLGLYASPPPSVEPARRRRWGSSSSSGSSTKLDTVPEDNVSRRELSVLSKALSLLLSAVVLFYQKLEIVWDNKGGVLGAVVGVFKWLQPTILKRLSSGSNFSSFEEDLGFGLMDESENETVDSAAAERERRQQRYEEKLDAAEAFGRRILTSLGRQMEAVDLPGWLSRAKTFALEHPIVTAGAGAAACTVAVPAVVAVTFVAAFLGVGFVGFLFVEGTLLTVGAIFVGTILLALGFVLLTIGIGILFMYIGVANAYNIASAVWSLIRGEKTEQNGRGRGHHHHLHHHHPPAPLRNGHHLHRHVNGFVPSQLPRTVENLLGEAQQQQEVKAE